MSEQLLKEILSEIKSMKDEIRTIKQEMVTKSDMEENTRILRALEHASQVNTAEMEGLKLNTATRDSIERLDAKFDVLNKRLFEQETELRLIKKAQ